MSAFKTDRLEHLTYVMGFVVLSESRKRQSDST